MQPFNPLRPFTNREASAAGLTPDHLRGPRFTPVFRGVYVCTSVTQTIEVRARAALLLAPSGSGLITLSAALLWSPMVRNSPEIQIAIPKDRRMQVDGINARRCDPLPTWHFRRTLPLTSPEQTFVDLGAILDLVELVVFGDYLVRHGHTTCQRLIAAAGGGRGRGVRLARQAASLVRERVDSAMESRLRLLIVLAGLPEPVVNLTLRFADGRAAYRIDLAYPDQMLAIEYDGRHHINRQEQWAADLARREALERLGWRFIVVIAADLYEHPEQTLTRIATGLGRHRTSHGQLWRRHFIGRSR